MFMEVVLKNLLYLFVISFVFVGCTYKNTAIELGEYNSKYIGKIAPTDKRIIIESVNDIRLDKHTIGYVIKDGKKKVTLHSHVDFEKRYKDDLKDALSSARFNLNNDSYNSLNLKVYIKKIEIIYDDEKFDKNLSGYIELEVFIGLNKETIKQNFREKSQKWISPSYDSKDLEPFLHEMFSDSINNIVSRLTDY